MEDNSIIDQINELLFQLYGNSTYGLYDYTSDLTFINDDSLLDILKYRKREISINHLKPNAFCFIAHERQHYIDLNYSCYGLKKIITYSNLKKLFEQDENLLINNLEFKLLIQQINERKNLLDSNKTISDSLLFIGLETRSEMVFKKSPNGILLYNYINVIIQERKNPNKEIGKLYLNEDSILELSALWAEYQFKLSNYGSHILDFEYEIFSMMHDFTSSEYLSAFHVAHTYIRDGNYKDKPNSPNFPLTISLMLGGFAARIAISIVGTSSARDMKWHPDFLYIAEANEWDISQLSQHCYSKLECVFYNIVFFAKETTFCLNTKDWIIELVQILGLNIIKMKSDIYVHAKNLNSRSKSENDCQITRERVQNSFNFLVQDFSSLYIQEKEFKFPDPVDQVEWMNLFSKPSEPPIFILKNTYGNSFSNYVYSSLQFQKYISSSLESN